MKRFSQGLEATKEMYKKWILTTRGIKNILKEKKSRLGRNLTSTVTVKEGNKKKLNFREHILQV